jgi:hypothetical protein
MSSKAGINVDTYSWLVDLTGTTADTQFLLGTLNKDYIEVVDFIVTTRVAGVGAQNIIFTLKTTPTQTITPFASVSAASAAYPNTTAAGGSVQTAGIGNSAATSLVENRNLFLDVDYAAGVTSGPATSVTVTLRK